MSGCERHPTTWPDVALYAVFALIIMAPQMVQALRRRR